MRRSVVTRHCLSKKIGRRNEARAPCWVYYSLSPLRCPLVSRCVGGHRGTFFSTATHQRRAPGGLVLTRYEGGGKWGPRHIPWSAHDRGREQRGIGIGPMPPMVSMLSRPCERPKSLPQGSGGGGGGGGGGNLYSHCIFQAELPSRYLISGFSSSRHSLVTLCVAVSDANTFLTSDWDMPNCRAICDGLIAALSAARTAFTCPRVNEIFHRLQLAAGPSMATASGPTRLLNLAGCSVAIGLAASLLRPTPL